MLRTLMCFLGFLWCLLPNGVTAQPIHFQQLNVEDGLSHNHVTSMVKDTRGFLWFGTPAGLNRYDGHEVKVFRHVSNQPGSIAHNDILALFIGPHEQLWVKTKQEINLYDDQTERFVRNGDSVLQSLGLPVAEVLDVRRTTHGDCWFLQAGGLVSNYSEQEQTVVAYPAQDTSASVTGIALDVQGNAWSVDQLGTVRRLSGAGSEVYRLQDQVADYPEGADFRLFIDTQGHPWVYAAGLPSGVYWWPQKEVPATHLTMASAGIFLNDQLIFGIAEDTGGNVWIATDHGGVNVVDRESRRVSHLLHDDYDDRTISQNSIMTLYCDRDGIMWAGTFKRGISYYHPSQIQFALYQRRRSEGDRGLPFDDINQFVEDRSGNVWIGTNGGGLIYFDRQANRFIQYRHDPNDVNSLGSDVIVSLFLDREGVLWIGTYHGGLNRFDGKQFRRYTYDPLDEESIPDNSVWEIYEDRKGRFWVGTLRAGLAQLDKKTGRFRRMGVGLDQFTQSAYISAIVEDHNGGLWFGTASGIELLLPDGTFKRFAYTEDRSGSLSNDYISAIIEDSKHRIWVATRDGVNLYDATTDTFRAFRTEDGLADNTLLSVVEDREGNVWVSSTKGISVIHEEPDVPGRWRCWNFDDHDGLQGIAFNEDAAALLSTGELFFGGPSGFNIIDPANIQSPPSLSTAPVLTDLQLFNRSVDASQWSGDGAIRFTHNQNDVGLVVASLYFLNKGRAYFRYKLEGFDQDWSTLDSRTRKATFTNLDPGTYRFQVRVSKDDETWSEPYTLTTFTILPPFWKTSWAYALYAVVGLGSILLIRYIERTREKTRFALQRERQEARSMLDSVLKEKAQLEQANKKKLTVFPSEKPVTSADEQFLHKLLDTVEQHLEQSDLSVEELAGAMNVSRVALYKRVLTLTGHTPSEFIRNIRLRRAGQLLEQSGLTVAEIAYEVGFGNPKQFSKYFKQLYGVVPSAYRK